MNLTKSAFWGSWRTFFLIKQTWPVDAAIGLWEGNPKTLKLKEAPIQPYAY